MTIYIYTGTPGSGKSAHATDDIRRALKRGKDVISNFGVVTDESWTGHFTHVQNMQLTPHGLVAYALHYWRGRKPKEDGILVVIDECQLLFNSRSWNDPNRMAWVEFFSQHRKYGYKIILIAQDDCMVDKQFRTLIEYQCDHMKVKNWGAFGALLNVLAFGNLFQIVTRYYQQNIRVDREFIKYGRKVYEMYNSYDSFKQGDGLTLGQAI